MNENTAAGSHLSKLVNAVPDGTSINHLTWSPEGVQINNLFVGELEVVMLLKDRNEEQSVRRLVQAATIGARALNQSEQSLNVDFMVHLLDQHVQSTTVSVGKIIQQTGAMIDEHLDGEKGTALAPIRLQVKHVEDTLAGSLAEILDALDPNRPDSNLGRALSKLGTLLDEKSVDSVQSTVKALVDRLASQDGALASAVKTTVQDVVKTQIEPLRDQIKSMEKELSDRKAVADLVNQTTAKGLPFEELVFGRCKSWAIANGGTAQHVGSDNKPGDILIEFDGAGAAGLDLRVAIETRDDSTAKGRKPICDDLCKAIAQREADAAIYCAKSSAAFAREVGEWDEGSVGGKPWIACTVEQLPQALRLVLLTERMRIRATAAGCLDVTAIRGNLEEIRVALRRVATIKRASTGITNSAAAVQVESDALLRQIEVALKNAEHSMNVDALAELDL